MSNGMSAMHAQYTDTCKPCGKSKVDCASISNCKSINSKDSQGCKRERRVYGGKEFILYKTV